MPTQQLAPNEVEQMRKLLAAHDAEHKTPQNIDLNKPPQVPYRFQKFPMMVYDLAGCKPAHDAQKPRPGVSGGVIIEPVHVPAQIVSVLVRDEKELQRYLSAGWSEEAPSYHDEPLLPSHAEKGSSPLDEMTKAELVAVAKECGIKIDPADKKEVILAALKAPDQAAA